MATVFVGLSGGVDSAVSAALLKEQGYDVVGAFIKIWQPEFVECTSGADRLDAMRVAAALGVPFREIDLSEEYKKEVVERMVADYSRGITPNPDVLCNEKIKFGHFFRWATQSGADFVATGHYARIEKQEGGYSLLRGKDPNKDQSYFLHRLGQKELPSVLFPVGGYTKTRVRALARRFGLPNAGRPDSQGLCFVGNVSMKDFLSRYIPLTPGPVLDGKGAVVGKHEGAALYTIGQRHGFKVLGGDNVAHYVVSLDIRKNEIIVSTEKEDAMRKELKMEDAHWIVPQKLPFSCEAQVRYRGEAERCTVRTTEGSYTVEFTKPVVASGGQSVVFYQEQCCLGGGVAAA
jgi:tRNA-specific 2-thiouridylase